MIKKIINHGDIVPRGYGIAYLTPDFCQQFVCYPFPLNHIIGWLRYFWYKIRHRWPTKIELDIRAENARRVGFENGWHAGQKSLRDEWERWVKTQLKEN